MSSNGNGQLGVIGLGVMGRNLALNVLDHGYRVIGFNRSPGPLEEALKQSGGRLVAADSLADLVDKLERPRKIMLMVKAGMPVDTLLNQLLPMLDRDDIVIDGGNSWFLDSRRRETEYARAGLKFYGIGVSGGEDGARNGPALMAGGDRQTWPLLAPMFESIAAKTESGACVALCGPDGAGHFVKMVHNGIEYADMQGIAEAYDILSRIGGLTAPMLAEVFANWNTGELESFLIELTSRILRVRDDQSDDFLVNAVLDRAGQKGTGRWAVRVALELGVPIPSIAAAVDARVLSNMKQERIDASKVIDGPETAVYDGQQSELISQVGTALLCTKIVAYAQGMSLIDAASREYAWGVNLSEVARIWKGGCIIRARLLDPIMKAFERNRELRNLLLDDEFNRQVTSRQAAWRQLISLAQFHGIPVGCMASSLCYFDSYRSEHLPQNLIQAQRDAFGAHTYQRRDDPEGSFRHTDWLHEQIEPG